MASLSESTYDGTNRASSSGSACNGANKAPSKSESKWLVTVLDFSVIVQTLFYECLRASGARISLLLF